MNHVNAGRAYVWAIRILTSSSSSSALLFGVFLWLWPLTPAKNYRVYIYKLLGLAMDHNQRHRKWILYKMTTTEKERTNLKRIISCVTQNAKLMWVRTLTIIMISIFLYTDFFYCLDTLGDVVCNILKIGSRSSSNDTTTTKLCLNKWQSAIEQERETLKIPRRIENSIIRMGKRTRKHRQINGNWKNRQ